MNELIGKEDESVVPARFKAGNTEKKNNKKNSVLDKGFPILERTKRELNILMEVKGLLAVKPNQEECVWC